MTHNYVTKLQATATLSSFLKSDHEAMKKCAFDGAFVADAVVSVAFVLVVHSSVVLLLLLLLRPLLPLLLHHSLRFLLHDE